MLGSLNREFRKFYVKFKANDATNLVSNLTQRRFELCMVINDQDESLTKLIFINQEMLNNYFQYNDVVLIDSTYKTKKYSYPLVIISGANNEGKNIIFEVAFINDETQAIYKWILNSFSNLMESVHPIVIISDQDLAIMSVMQDVFPYIVHFLCKWHNERNFIKHPNQIRISKKNY